MAKILDLNQFIDDTFDLILFDGSTLKLKKPTKAMATKLMTLKMIDGSDSEKALDAIGDAIATVLSNNSDNRAFDSVYVDNNFNYAVQMVILKSYTDWMNEIVNQKN